jgi:hypothetical protein
MPSEDEEIAAMAEPQLSVRSARARDLAHKLAHHEQRTVAQVVERALELYARQHHGTETAQDFLARIQRECSVDIDLDALIRIDREPHAGIDL